MRAARNLLLPTAAIFYYFLFGLGLDTGSRTIKILQTLLGIEIIWLLLTLVKVALFFKSNTNDWRSGIPGLLIDVIRFAMVIVGTAFVVAGVWNKDLGAFLATLGIGSIVLGLALQDTLGSLMAGIALVIERPFNEGDWIRVGDLEGKVIEINWRSVRMINRQSDVVIVPNSVLGKERIQNLSKPTSVHATVKKIGFSYDDPPNKARKVLLETALSTPKILANPRPRVRTKEYLDFSILYEVKFFVTDCDSLLDIESDFMTNVWYAAKRNNLTIPFPIRTVNKTEIPYQPKAPSPQDLPGEIRRVPLFRTLSEEELQTVARRAIVRNYAQGEIVVRQREKGDSLFIICQGSASVEVKDENGRDNQVARLNAGDFFGEMSILSGEPRSANVVGLEDLEVVIIGKAAVKALLENRPDLANEFSQIVEERQRGLSHIQSQSALTTTSPPEEKQMPLLERIKNFFSI